MKITCLIILFLFSSYDHPADAQNHYILDLKGGDWHLTPSLFYISDILDERQDKSNAGFALYNGKIQTAEFKNSLGEDLKSLLSGVTKDTSKIPLLFTFEKFKINETGTINHHMATLDFSMKVYRLIHDKRYQLYEAKGNPSMDMHGPYQQPFEKIIGETMKKVIENFNSWLNENANLPPLARKVIVIFNSTPGNMPNKSDTILWSNNYKLRWTDFKGKPGDSPFMAQSNCLFTYRADPEIKNGNLELHIDLFACFDKNFSFVKNGEQNDSLLAHEQLHFDICEVNMRLLRGKISKAELDIMDFDSQIKSLFSKSWIDYEEEQQRYDDETGHGIHMDKQQKWQEEISKQLKNISFEGSVLQ